MNKPTPKISIVVPIFNVENYLQRCIDSIINQTYINIEIILVNDGSTDSCFKICEKYAKQDARILVIDKKNGGLGSARNAGIEKMTGDYVAFVDSDDCLDSFFIEKLFSLLKLHDADIAVCGFCGFAKENELNKKKKRKIVTKTLDSNNSLKNMFRWDGIGWTAWNKLYKASLFDLVRYEEGVYSEDMATTYKLYFQSTKVVWTNEPLYYYFHREDGIMRSKPPKRYRDEMIIIKQMISFFDENIEQLSSYPKAFCGKIALNNLIALRKSDSYVDIQQYCILSLKDYWKITMKSNFVRVKYKLIILFFIFLECITGWRFDKSKAFLRFCKKTKAVK